MTPSNREKLERLRPKLNVWVNDKTVHLDGIEKQEILNIIREEFNPGYQVDLWCGHCVVKMLEYAFAEMDKTVTLVIDLAPEPIIYKKKKK